MWAVQAAQLQDVPPSVRAFLQRHEADEAEHLERFESILGVRSWGRAKLPAVPQQWCALAVHLLGYEALGLEFAKFLTARRPDLSDILRDEEGHVAFFEREVRSLMGCGTGPSRCTVAAARSWWRKLPRTLDRYLGDESLAPYRALVGRHILMHIERRFVALNLLPEPALAPCLQESITTPVT